MTSLLLRSQSTTEKAIRSRISPPWLRWTRQTAQNPPFFLLKSRFVQCQARDSTCESSKTPCVWVCGCVSVWVCEFVRGSVRGRVVGVSLTRTQREKELGEKKTNENWKETRKKLTKTQPCRCRLSRRNIRLFSKEKPRAAKSILIASWRTREESKNSVKPGEQRENNIFPRETLRQGGDPRSER